MAKRYNRGQVAMGNGNLIQVTSVKLDTQKSSKHVHTLAKQGAGFVSGNEETKVSFDAVVDEDGPERDYFRLLKNGLISQIRLKLDGLTLTIESVTDAVSIEVPVDSEVKMSISFIGNLLD